LGAYSIACYWVLIYSSPLRCCTQSYGYYYCYLAGSYQRLVSPLDWERFTNSYSGFEISWFGNLGPCNRWSNYFASPLRLIFSCLQRR